MKTSTQIRQDFLDFFKSKGHKDRVVFMSEDMLQMCKKYDRLMQKLVPDREWFFPGRVEAKPFSKTAIDKKFSELKYNLFHWHNEIDILL